MARKRLIDILDRLLRNFNPIHDMDSYLQAMNLLRELDRQQALTTMGDVCSWDEADEIVAAYDDISPRSIFDNACPGCGSNITRLHEYPYMTTADICAEAGHPDGCWCIGCLEQLLGRRLIPGDFNWDSPITSEAGWTRSERLLERMLGS